MGDYNRTIWKDHIKDQNENVIQQGTPVSAQNLNNIENQIVVLSAKENSLAELVRESIPSGFTTLSDLDYTFMSINSNAIKLASDSVAYVNGYKTTITAGTVINLDVPPTSGSRDDLVFLECWKQTDSNGSVSWNYRIRVVDGIDFSTYQEGILNTSLVKARGGQTSDTTYTFSKSNIDVGLYVSGNGSSTAISALNTSDGYVYAIPMFRVHRRNSGGYSANNGNGANNFYSIRPSNSSLIIQGGNTAQATVPSTSSLSVGDIVYRSDSMNVPFQVMSIDSSTLVTIKALYDNTLTFNFSSSFLFYCKYVRQDKMYSNIIADRDILDLRRQVSLTGFNYQQLLEENFDKLLRGELQTNAKNTMLKTYHGIPKTPIDANHIFYASFDGTVTPELGTLSSIIGTLNKGSSPHVTGIGLSTDGFIINTGISSGPITIDMWIKKDDLTGQWQLGLTSSDIFIDAYNLSPSSIYLRNNTGAGFASTIGITKEYTHIRLIIVPNDKVYFYIDGMLANSRAIGSVANYNVALKNFSASKLTIADFSISNIDRGEVFATLPQDFIDGYARIDKAFNEQRNVFSDALTSETITNTVKAAGEIKRQFTVTQAVSGTWANGDKIKVKGLGGEIITGVIDGDTALATLVGTCSVASTTPTFTVDDVSKLNVNDTVVLMVDNDITHINTGTITAIDTTLKTVTITFPNKNFTSNIGGYLFETTASSSSPTVKTNLTGTAVSATVTTLVLPSTFSATDDAYNGSTVTVIGGKGAGQSATISDYIGSTKTLVVPTWTITPDATSTFLITGMAVSGTWSGLGTNEATFTLGTNANLTSQNLYITYLLNEIPGQGGMPEVLTTVLAGEIGGKKLTLNPGVHVRDDFAGKVSGDTIACPNVAKNNVQSTSLQTPSGSWSEFSEGYSTVPSLDGNCVTSTTLVNGQIAQQLFSFNLIRIIEDKFGTLPCGSDIASKVAWLKANISKIICNCYGYGSCPSGNKAYLNIYSVLLSAWSNTPVYNTTSNVAINTRATTSPSDVIDSSGFVHYLTYTDASDSITPSAINTDYINIEIILLTPNGYDVLAPENPRRDNGKGNILLVRKETKEIQAMFGGVSNNSGIISYGSYVPYQGMAVSNGMIKALSARKCITTAGTGGVPLNDNAGIMKNILAYFPIPNGYSIYNFSNAPLSLKDMSANSANVLYIQINGYYEGKIFNTIGSTTSGIDAGHIVDLPVKTNAIGITFGLKNVGGELRLIVAALIYINGIASTTTAVADYVLANKPLIK